MGGAGDAAVRAASAVHGCGEGGDGCGGGGEEGGGGRRAGAGWRHAGGGGGVISASDSNEISTSSQSFLLLDLREVE